MLGELIMRIEQDPAMRVIYVSGDKLYGVIYEPEMASSFVLGTVNDSITIDRCFEQHTDIINKKIMEVV